MKIWYKTRRANVAVYVDSSSPVFGYLISKIDTKNQEQHIITNDHIQELITFLDMFIVLRADRITPPEFNDKGEVNPIYDKLTDDEAHYYKKHFSRLAPYCKFVPYFKVDDIS